MNKEKFPFPTASAAATPLPTTPSTSLPPSLIPSFSSTFFFSPPLASTPATPTPFLPLLSALALPHDPAAPVSLVSPAAPSLTPSLTPSRTPSPLYLTPHSPLFPPSPLSLLAANVFL